MQERPRTKRARPLWLHDLRKDWMLYTMALPAIVAILIFSYGPMVGAAVAFLDYSPYRGITGSAFIGLDNFRAAFNNPLFMPALRNTIIINVLKLAVGFPSALILALLLNEVRLRLMRSVVQTATMLPYFISWVVAASVFRTLLDPQGVVNGVLGLFGARPISFLSDPILFRWVVVFQDTWKYVGYFAVIYLAAMVAIDPVLYEAAEVDGANRWQQTWHVTLPGIRPTMITLFVILTGYLMQGGLEQLFAMYNTSVYSTGDILETFTYRLGIQQNKYGLATAVGLFQAVISIALVVLTNFMVRRYNRQEQSLF